MLYTEIHSIYLNSEFVVDVTAVDLRFDVAHVEELFDSLHWDDRVEEVGDEDGNSVKRIRNWVEDFDRHYQIFNGETSEDQCVCSDADDAQHERNAPVNESA